MSHPVEMFGTQNLKDDDGAVIDSFFVETDAPPDMTAATEPIEATPYTPIVVTTKILSQNFLWYPGFSAPYMLLPSDENRRQFHMRVTSPTAVATDGIRWGSDISTVKSAGILFHGQTSGAVDNHTGAIWVWGVAATDTPGSPVPVSAPVVVAVWSVTI